MAKKPGSNLGRLAGAVIMIAATELVFSVILAQHLYPGYNLNTNYISDLGVGSVAWLFNPAIIVFGALLILGALLLWKGGKHKLAAMGFIIVGIGGMGVGAFPETTGIYHIISADITFGAVSVLAIGFSRIFKGKLSYYSLVAGILAILVVALFGVTLVGLKVSTGLGHGGVEEILFYDELIWAFVVGTCFIKKII